MSYDAYGSQKDWEESNNFKPLDVQAKELAEAVKRFRKNVEKTLAYKHWCSRVGSVPYKDKVDGNFNPAMSGDSTQL